MNYSYNYIKDQMLSLIRTLLVMYTILFFILLFLGIAQIL